MSSIKTNSIIKRVDPDVARQLVSLIKFTHNFLTEHDIVYWMNGGTYLGAVRHKGVIPWDDDADFTIMNDDVNKLKSLKSLLKIYGFGLVEFWAGWKIYDLKGKKMKGYKWKYPWIDLFPMKIVNNSTRTIINYKKVMKSPIKYKNWVIQYAGSQAHRVWSEYETTVSETFPLKLYKFHDFKLIGQSSYKFFDKGYPGWKQFAYKDYDHETERQITPIKVKLVDKTFVKMSGPPDLYPYPYDMWDAAYVINLAFMKNRMNDMDKKCNQFGLRCKRFNAIFKTNISVPNLINKGFFTNGLLKANAESNPLVKPGHTARYMAELKIFKEAIELGHDKVLILEDDVTFRKDFVDKIKKMWSELPKDFDIFWLDFDNEYTDKRKHLVSKPFSKHLIIPAPKQGWFKNTYFQTGAYGYIISKRAMKIYLKYAVPMTAAANAQLGLLGFGKQWDWQNDGSLKIKSIPAKDKLKVYAAHPRLLKAQTERSSTSSNNMH